jgi:osmotically-inducible protein OsmY
MTSDSELKADLIERLDAIPAADTAEVEVVVEQGMVTLNGQVDSHQTRFQIERAARKIAGVRGLRVNISPRHGATKNIAHSPY